MLCNECDVDGPADSVFGGGRFPLDGGDVDHSLRKLDQTLLWQERDGAFELLT